MSDIEDSQVGVVTSVSEVETDPAGIVKRWVAELDLSDASEKDWREEGERIWTRYEQGSKEQDDFNILWSNTETLAPAVYNSRPEPDVRRRFRDADPVGRYASMVLERSLTYTIDTDDFDEVVKDAVLDALLPGRGVARIKYEPKFQTVPAASQSAPPQPESLEPGTMQASDTTGSASLYTPAQQPAAAGVGDTPLAPGNGAAEGAAHAEQQYEVIADEKTPVEHVQWNDFRHGPGKRWKDVWWVAFRHRMSYDELEESFGEQMAKKIPLEESPYEGPDTEEYKDQQKIKAYFRKAEIWEIWDKQKKRVLFISRAYKYEPIKVVDDPLELQDFFPLPRPIEAVRTSRSLVPIPVFRLYKRRAAELDRLTKRIEKVTNALKLRGAYDARLEEANKILSAGDNDMVPIKNCATVLAQAGTLDKAIWIAPVDKLIQILEGLYNAREQVKQAIYEITGISDIIRGSTVASETATAQQIKSKWGTIRLQRLQGEVQRFVKDLMRLMSDLIARRFTQQTLSKMTGVQLPMQADKDQAKGLLQQQQVAYQAAVIAWQRQGQQLGQPQPQPPQADPQMLTMLSLPSWEDVIGLLRSDALRTCKVDVETDSTVQAMQDQDLQGIGQVMQMIGQLIQGAVPAVQSGMLTVEAVRDMAQAIARRARLGSVFEDALDQMQAPQQQPPAAQQGAQQLAQAVGQIHGMVADLHSRATGQPPHTIQPAPTSTPQLPQ